MHESTLPPLTLRVQLTNTGTEAIEVCFVLCKSVLGDFAVRPEKLTLAPGQSVGPDPMTSRLGLATEELPLQLDLRMGNKTERKTITLKRKSQAEPN